MICILAQISARFVDLPHQQVGNRHPGIRRLGFIANQCNSGLCIGTPQGLGSNNSSRAVADNDMAGHLRDPDACA
ncbi:MAG: hypothetical protein CAPSK01_004116 [Candidatus Accumulibacter vicinus]|uniref:Uncharacterized protein n=1 Tax=Candidatus Accumulibacter vicinus TaxID=2954382 RepID=A0A084XVV1_9PROT|nr:MAG: hypothetical protein CAPSK01_004116 [Candidatus Accumulibacter vicinus]